MIALEKGREIAEELAKNSSNIPSTKSLNAWRHRGLITGVKDYEEKGRSGGRIGLYDETLPVQIATVADLKENFSMDQIEKACKKVIGDIELKVQEPRDAYQRALDNALITKDEQIGRFEVAKYRTFPDQEIWERLAEAKDKQEIKEVKDKINNHIKEIEIIPILRIYSEIWDQHESNYFELRQEQRNQKKIKAQ